mgnify:CR=1 FL=1
MLSRRFTRVFNVVSAFVLLVLVNFVMYEISSSFVGTYTLTEGIILEVETFVTLYIIYTCIVSKFFVYKDEQYLYTLTTSKLYLYDEDKFYRFYALAFQGYMYSILVAMLSFSMFYLGFTWVYIQYLQGLMPIIVYIILSLSFYSIIIYDVCRLYGYSRRFEYGIK